MIRSKPHTITAKHLSDVIRNVQESEARLRMSEAQITRDRLSRLALDWYDTQQAEGGVTRDAFHLFVLGLIPGLPEPRREALPAGFISDEPGCQPG